MVKFHLGEDARPQKQREKLPQMNSVVAGQTAYLNMPVGLRYHDLSMNLGGTTFDYTHITAIRLLGNGEVFQTISGTDRNAINQYLGLAAASGTPQTLIMPFERIGLDDLIERYRTCINTGVKSKGGGQSRQGLLTFRIEVDIDAGAVAPTIDLYTNWSDVNLEQSTLLPRIDSWSEAIVAGVENLHVNSPKMLLNNKLRPYCERLLMKDTNAHITAFRLRENNVETVNRTSLMNEAHQKSWRLRTPQAGYVVYDPAETGEANNFIHGDVLSSLDVYSTHAVGATTPLTVIAETMGILGS